MHYTFDFNLDENYYLEFNIYHNYNSKASKRILLSVQLLFPAVLIVSFLINLTKHESAIEMVPSGISLILAIVFFLVVFRFLFKSSLKWTIRLMKKEGRLPFSKNNRLQFDEENIYEFTEVTESKFKYSTIEKIAENDNAIYIYISAMQAIIIPFSVFKGEAEKEEFITFIKRKKRVT